jgi:hypothetical protein
LDGYRGLVFHVLQGFWYRFLVDAKLYEARRHVARHNGDIIVTARELFGIDLEKTNSPQTNKVYTKS